eukprot:scaffold10009_cov105-Cylindrotheca_fusiformis.AAC.4
MILLVAIVSLMDMDPRTFGMIFESVHYTDGWPTMKFDSLTDGRTLTVSSEKDMLLLIGERTDEQNMYLLQ